MALITSAKAAELLGVSKRTVHRMVDRGDLRPVEETDLGYLFDRDTVVDKAEQIIAATRT